MSCLYVEVFMEPNIAFLSKFDIYDLGHKSILECVADMVHACVYLFVYVFVSITYCISYMHVYCFHVYACKVFSHNS